MAEGLADIAELQRTTLTLLDQLAPAARSRALTRLSREIQKFQQRRMKAQVGPDGTPWTPRKTRKPAQKGNAAQRFVYRNAKGETRQAQMRSWAGRGPVMTGYDQEAEGIRTFRQDRVIARGLAVEGGGADPGPRKSRRQPSAMFAKLRLEANLKSGSSPAEAFAEFTRQSAGIARVHHDGLRDQVAPGGPMVDYPRRPLVGWGGGDEAAILEAFIEHLTGRL